MTYATPAALRMALEQRLLTRSRETGVSLDRLRRRVVFERVVARLQAAEPGRWVLKGGMALEVRLHDRARLTRDLDLGLRDEVTSADDLRQRLVEALTADQDGDRFVLRTGAVKRLTTDRAGDMTWRSKVVAELAGRPFGSLQLDVSPRTRELTATEHLPLPSSLDFAGIVAPTVEIIDVHRHAAEKLHGMQRELGDRENTRVRDLADLVILVEHELLDTPRVADAVRQVWAEREGADPPVALPRLPPSWPARYEALAVEHDLATATFPDAVAIVDRLWAATASG